MFDQQIELELASMISDFGGEKPIYGMAGPEKMKVNFWVRD